MVNKLLAIRWLKSVVVKKQCYEFAAWLRDEERNAMNLYDSEWKDKFGGWQERDKSTYEKAKNDPYASKFKQYQHILNYIEESKFRNNNLTKIDFLEIARTEFLQVIREENLNKILE